MMAPTATCRALVHDRALRENAELVESVCAAAALTLENERSNKAIASRLFVTEHTVEKHVKNIFATLRLPPSLDDHRRVRAVVAYLDSK